MHNCKLHNIRIYFLILDQSIPKILTCYPKDLVQNHYYTCIILPKASVWKTLFALWLGGLFSSSTFQCMREVYKASIFIHVVYVANISFDRFFIQSFKEWTCNSACFFILIFYIYHTFVSYHYLPFGIVKSMFVDNRSITLSLY